MKSVESKSELNSVEMFLNKYKLKEFETKEGINHLLQAIMAERQEQILAEFVGKAVECDLRDGRKVHGTLQIEGTIAYINKLRVHQKDIKEIKQL